jgi:hypothetical protein
MLTVKCPLHFLGTSGDNIITNAYWWTVPLSCATTNISHILLNSQQFCEILEWPVTVWWPTSVQFPLVSDCRLSDQGKIKFVSVVNNKVCVVILKTQVMYFIFQLYRKNLKITNVNKYSDELNF